MHEMQTFIGENKLSINLNNRSTSIPLPLSVDALLFSLFPSLLLSSSTKLGDLNANDLDGEETMNFGSIDL